MEAIMALPSINKLDVKSLITLREQIDIRLSEMRGDLERQLAALSNGHAVVKSRGKTPGKKHALKGRKLVAKYRSKKDPKLQWAGRGMMPVWMKDEMKIGKLKKDAFLIK
jgi:DNA-binding protein H-NS